MIGRLFLLALTALVLLLVGCGDDPDPSERAVDRGLAATRGVEQNGFTLGAAGAPATLTIYGAATDLRILSVLSDELPEFIPRFVRSGRVRLQWRTTVGDGADTSDEAGAVTRLLLSSGLVANSFWPTAVVLAAEFTGAWDDSQAVPLLRKAGVARASAVLRRRGDPRIANAIRRADESAREQGIGNDPGWVLTTGNATQDITRDIGRTSLIDAVADAVR